MFRGPVDQFAVEVVDPALEEFSATAITPIRKSCPHRLCSHDTSVQLRCVRKLERSTRSGQCREHVGVLLKRSQT